MLADLAPHALGRGDAGVSRTRHERQTAARAPDAPGLVRLRQKQQGEVVDGDDPRARLPEWHFVIRPVEEREAAPRGVARQADRPPVTAEGADGDAREF
jgi:hypothetical protein